MNEIQLISKSDKSVKIKLKEIITAEIRVEYTRIYRQFDSERAALVTQITADDFDHTALTEDDYLRAVKITNYLNANRDDTDNLLFELYSFEFIKVFLHYIIKRESITEKSILEMVDNSDNELWNKQSLEELQKALNSFRQKV